MKHSNLLVLIYRCISGKIWNEVTPIITLPDTQFSYGFLGAWQCCEKRLWAVSYMSIRPHETTRLPLDGFSWNLFFEYFSKICRENSSFINMGQEQRVLYMKTNIHFYIIFRSVLLRTRNVSDRSCRHNQNTYCTLNILFFFSKIVAFVR